VNRRGGRLAALLAVVACVAPLGVAQAADAPRPQDNFALAVAQQDGDSQFDFSWSLFRQRGGDVDSENHARAITSCASCRAVAIAFQVVLVTGEPGNVVPKNIAEAANLQSDSSLAFAGAKQIVWAVDRPVRFNREGRHELADVRNDIRALEGQDTLTADQLATALDDDRDRVIAVLQNDLVPIGHGHVHRLHREVHNDSERG
jgi:putative peptide zinc metalloprotease protein